MEVSPRAIQVNHCRKISFDSTLKQLEITNNGYLRTYSVDEIVSINIKEGKSFWLFTLVLSLILTEYVDTNKSDPSLIIKTKSNVEKIQLTNIKVESLNLLKTILAEVKHFL